MGFEVPGPAAHDGSQPRLMAMLEQVADRLCAPPVDEVYLSADLNAYAVEVGRFFRAPRRIVVLGMPLFKVLSAGELASVIAHELAHLVADDARHSATRQATTGMLETLAALASPDSKLGKLATAGAAQNQAEVRAAELAADRRAAQVVGAEPCMSAIVRLSVAAPLFADFLQNAVGLMIDLGYRPANLYDGFSAFLDEATGTGAAGALAGELKAQQTLALDSHPALAERIAALMAFEKIAEEAAPDDRPRERALVVVDGPASSLLADASKAEGDVTEAWASRLAVPAPLQTIGWDQMGTAVVEPWLRARAGLVERVLEAAGQPLKGFDAAHWLLEEARSRGAAAVAAQVDPALAGSGAPDDVVSEVVSNGAAHLLAVALLEGPAGAESAPPEAPAQLDHRLGAPLTVVTTSGPVEPVELCARALAGDDVAWQEVQRLCGRSSTAAPAP